MTPDAWVALALCAFGASGYVVGWCAGYGRADDLWSRRHREQRRALIDAHRRLAVFEERERDAHERCRLTADEHETFMTIAEREDGS